MDNSDGEDVVGLLNSNNVDEVKEFLQKVENADTAETFVDLMDHIPRSNSKYGYGKIAAAITRALMRTQVWLRGEVSVAALDTEFPTTGLSRMGSKKKAVFVKAITKCFSEQNQNRKQNIRALKIAFRSVLLPIVKDEAMEGESVGFNAGEDKVSNLYDIFLHFILSLEIYMIYLICLVCYVCTLVYRI